MSANNFYVLLYDDIDEDSTGEDYLIEYYKIDSSEIELYLCEQCSEFSEEDKLSLIKRMIKEYEISESHMYQFKNKKKSVKPLEKNN